MKPTYYHIMALAAMLSMGVLSSCDKDLNEIEAIDDAATEVEQVETAGLTTFTATIQEDDITRAWNGTKKKYVFEVGDYCYVYGGDSKTYRARFDVTSVSDGVATFTIDSNRWKPWDNSFSNFEGPSISEISSSNYVALFGKLNLFDIRQYNPVSWPNDNTFEYNLLDNQYVLFSKHEMTAENAFRYDAMMISSFSSVEGGISTGITFKNMCAVLKFKVNDPAAKTLAFCTNDMKNKLYYNLVNKDWYYGNDIPDPNKRNYVIELPVGTESFDPDKEYYCPVLPGTAAWTVLGSEQREATYSSEKFDRSYNRSAKDVTLEAGKIYNMGTFTPAEKITLNSSSPEGTIGWIGGREAIAVDLGGSLGKVAVATVNEGGLSPYDYGNRYTYAGVQLADGWYVPSNDEIRALLDRSTVSWATNGMFLKIGSSSIFLPAAGREYSGEYDLAIGKEGAYLTSTMDGSNYKWFGIDVTTPGVSSITPSSSESKCSVRPFHKLD